MLNIILEITIAGIEMPNMVTINVKMLKAPPRIIPSVASVLPLGKLR
jgi:hypothetical protein